jgi:hypothetical protein
VPPGRAGRRDAASSVAPIASAMSAPCVLASRRPSHPVDEAHYEMSSDMEQKVKGLRSVGWFSSRPGAADRPEQRRWIRLTFAGRDGMTGNRRELPLSKFAGHRRAMPHRALVGSPCGRAHPLLEVERLTRFQVVRSGCSVAIAQTKPASSRAQATTIFCCGLPRPASRCQRWCSRCWQRQARSITAAS